MQGAATVRRLTVRRCGRVAPCCAGRVAPCCGVAVLRCVALRVVPVVVRLRGVSCCSVLRVACRVAPCCGGAVAVLRLVAVSLCCSLLLSLCCSLLRLSLCCSLLRSRRAGLCLGCCGMLRASVLRDVALHGVLRDVALHGAVCCGLLRVAGCCGMCGVCGVRLCVAGVYWRHDRFFPFCPAGFTAGGTAGVVVLLSEDTQAVTAAAQGGRGERECTREISLMKSSCVLVAGVSGRGRRQE